MGKWGKYLKKYNPKWEKEARLKNWLEPSKEVDVLNGKPEAYCKLCLTHIRAHHSDLLLHANREKHKQKESALNRKDQRSLEEHGYVALSTPTKAIDLRLAVFVCMHCSFRAIDHLGEMLKLIGKGSDLESLRLHRTKTSALISNVIAPSFLDELVKDIGSADYSIIADEATDVSVIKFMGLCVRYFSRSRLLEVTDFLGIVVVVSCTGKDLADALIEYLEQIGLPLKQFFGVGTDGAPNMCGPRNSFFSHLKARVPHLQLIQCVCHSLNKCAEYAFKSMPPQLQFLMAESHNYFAHSAKTWNEFEVYHKEKNPGNEGKNPRRLKSLCKTRWLIWLPVSSGILDQWSELRGYFNRVALAGDDHTAKCLALLYNDNSNLLYLTFLRTIFREVQDVNLSFEAENPDITKIYSDLRTLVFATAKRVLRPQAIANTYRPSVLRVEEVEILSNAFGNPDNLLPPDRMNFGEAFKTLSTVQTGLDLGPVRQKCGDFLVELCKQLFARLPRNLPAINKIRQFIPRFTLAKVERPSFDQLPLEFADPSVDRDLLESQWRALGELNLSDVCSHLDKNNDIENMDIVHFWACVSTLKNARGESPFKDISNLALRVLSLPVSNAVDERVFSVLSSVKTKHRNRLQLKMLDALLRIRVHLKVDKLCCKDFKPTEEMLRRFNSSIYPPKKQPQPEILESSPGASVAPEEEESADDPDLLLEQRGGVCGVGESGIELEEEDYEDVAAIFREDTGDVACFVNIST